MTVMRSLLYAAIAFILFACSRDHAFDCFRSNGSDVTELRSPGTFTAIEVGSQIDVTIAQGSSYAVTVTAGDHVIKNIRTRVKDNVLEIENTNRCNFVRGYKRTISVVVTVPYLRQLIHKGVGSVSFDAAYSQDTLHVKAESSGDIHVSGTYTAINSVANANGDVYLNGSCNTLYAYTNGTNFLHAENLLVADLIQVQALSLGNSYLNATQAARINYDIWSSGNIYYTGNPTLIDLGEGTGKGQIIKQE